MVVIRSWKFAECKKEILLFSVIFIENELRIGQNECFYWKYFKTFDKKMFFLKNNVNFF